MLANVYLKKAAADQGVVIGTKADAKGFISVKGEITTDDLAKLAETDGTAFDLTKATLGEGVTAVQFKNPNAIIQVAGTLVDNYGVPTADWGETKNVVVKDREWYFPAKQLEITDKYAVYRDFYISGVAGYKYTRSLAAKAITFDIEGTATGIKDIHAVDAAKAGNVYSIDGKLVKANAATTEGLSKGVYVINGKKYVVK